MNHSNNYILQAAKSLLLFALVTLMLMSCGKDVERFTIFIKGDITTFSSEVQTLSETFEADASQDIFHISESGRTLMRIPANSLRTASGDLYSGDVDIEFLEITDKGVMVMYQKQTATDGELLESAGEFYIKVTTKDGNNLVPGEQGYNLYILDDNPDPRMKLFYGDTNENGNFVWVAEDSTGQWGVAIGEWGFQNPEFFGFGYEVALDGFDWINIDKFFEIPDEEKTKVCVELPEIYTNTNTIVFMIFQDYKSVVGMVGNPEIMQFCEPYAQVPIGFNVTFVAISDQGLDNDRFHFGMKNAVIEENHFENIFLEEKSLNEILDILGMF